MTTRFSLFVFSLGGLWSFEKSRSCLHFVCTSFIVVGTRLSKYRQLPMEVRIFVKYSKLGGGLIFNQSTLISIIIALSETFILLQLDLLFNILKWLIKIVDCVIFVLKSRHKTSFLLPFLPILVIYRAFLPAYFEDLQCLNFRTLLMGYVTTFSSKS